MTKRAFYTRKGDQGNTGMLGEGRVSKGDARIQAVGAVDEANAGLGLFRSLLEPEDEAYQSVLAVQKRLYHLMSDLVLVNAEPTKIQTISDVDVSWLEAEIDKFERQIEIPREFIVPGDHILGAMMDLARTTVRRAEREIVAFYQQEPDRNPSVLQFINRLSSFCYVMELYVLQIKKDIKVTSIKDL